MSQSGTAIRKSLGNNRAPLSASWAVKLHAAVYTVHVFFKLSINLTMRGGILGMARPLRGVDGLGTLGYLICPVTMNIVTT